MAAWATHTQERRARQSRARQPRRRGDEGGAASRRVLTLARAVPGQAPSRRTTRSAIFGSILDGGAAPHPRRRQPGLARRAPRLSPNQTGATDGAGPPKTRRGCAFSPWATSAAPANLTSFMSLVGTRHLRPRRLPSSAAVEPSGVGATAEGRLAAGCLRSGSHVAEQRTARSSRCPRGRRRRRRAARSACREEPRFLGDAPTNLLR